MSIPSDWKCDYCRRGVTANFLQNLLGPPAGNLRQIVELGCGHFMHDGCVGWDSKETAKHDLTSPTGYSHDDMKCATCKQSFSKRQVFIVPQPASSLPTNLLCLTMTAGAVACAVAVYLMKT